MMTSHTRLTTLGIIILISLAACQNDLSANQTRVLPTVLEFPALTPAPRRLNPIQPTVTAQDAPTQSAAPLVVETPTPPPGVGLIPLPTVPAAQVTDAPTLTLSHPAARALPDAFTFGQSVQGRDLTARRFGTGENLIMLVGGIHGGWESNTVELMNALIAHYEAAPSDVLEGITLVIVPALNPDGAVLGRTVDGRFNANRVDLNRNWDCGWEPTAFFRSTEVSPGRTPFSEPESAALASLILEVRPRVVLFYHSAANGVYEGDCGGDFGGAELARVLGEATGYSYGSDFSAYPVTGTAPAWVNAQGIPSADVELATWQEPEFERNLRGVKAVQCWIAGANNTQCP